MPSPEKWNKGLQGHSEKNNAHFFPYRWSLPLFADAFVALSSCFRPDSAGPSDRGECHREQDGGILYERVDMFVDIALAYAMLNFIAVLAGSRYFQKRKGLYEEPPYK